MNKLILPLMGLLLLAGCVSQEQADQVMARGCEAGVNSLLGSAKIKEIKSTNFSDETTPDGIHRRITLNTVTEDGWLELDKKYSCLFAQQWGLFKSSHNALLVQADMGDGKIIGKVDGKIIGDMNDFMNLTSTIDSAMRH